MKITVQVEVPDDEDCVGCQFNESLTHVQCWSPMWKKKIWEGTKPRPECLEARRKAKGKQ
jgi:hypothetical protein